MAVGETVIVVASASRVLLERGRAQVSTLVATRSAVPLIPTAATYQLVAPGGAVLANLSTDDTMTINATTGVVSAPLTALVLADTLSYGEGYQERWTLTIGGIVRSFQRMAVLSRFELHPPVAESDLVAGEYPDLQSALGNFGQTLQAFMDGTWSELLRYLARYGTWADIIVEPSDLYDLYRHMVFERVFRALAKMQEANERWRALWEFHRDEMRSARDGLRVQVDRDRDGMADDLGMQAVVRSIHVNVGPRRRLQRPWRWG